MGEVFELIADSALEQLDDYYKDCHVCEKAGVDLYPYQGSFEADDGTVDDDIYAVCLKCIRTKNIAHVCDFEFIKKIGKYLTDQGLSDADYQCTKIALVEKYQRTPRIPLFMQEEDKPLCCQDITEFVGYPKNDEELIEKTESHLYWEDGLKPKSDDYNFRKYGGPESYSDVAFFRCAHCQKKYFTFQFT